MSGWFYLGEKTIVSQLTARQIARDNEGFLPFERRAFEKQPPHRDRYGDRKDYYVCEINSGSTISQNNIWHYLAGNEGNYD